MKHDLFFLVASFVSFAGATAFNWEFWGKVFAIYCLGFLTAATIFNLFGKRIDKWLDNL